MAVINAWLRDSTGRETPESSALMGHSVLWLKCLTDVEAVLSIARIQPTTGGSKAPANRKSLQKLTT